jgi:RhoGEF, Guanine nucleotide exchange factor for Rho/Rac/Cdc42-like GTPases
MHSMFSLLVKSEKGKHQIMDNRKIGIKKGKLLLKKCIVSEFLDPSDKSLAHVVFAQQQLESYPVAILDVSKNRILDPEYLLCFNVFGVFVDKYGQRTRPDDIKWSHLPLSFGKKQICAFASMNLLYCYHGIKN